ncbi:hypothetical protein D3C81_1394480 [compost metagenome]
MSSGRSAVVACSLLSRNLVMLQPCPSAPIRFSTGTRTLSKKVSFRWCASSMLRIGRTVTPGVFMSTSRKLMPACFFTSVSVRTSRKIQSAWWA